LNKGYLNYQKQYGRIGSSVLSGKLGGIGYRLTDGLVNPKSIGLILSEVLNLLIVNLLTFFKVSRLIGKFRDLKINRSLQLFKKYKKFPLYEIPMDFLNFGAKKIPILLLAFYFDYIIVGYYVFAENILLKFVELISKNMGQVYYKKIAESHDRKNITILTIKTLFLIGFFPFVILGITGEKLFYFIFGEQWEMAGVFCQMLSGYLFLYFIFKTINSIYRIYNRQDKMLYFNILYFVLVTISIAIGGFFENVLLTIGLISISCFLVYLGIIFYALNLMNIRIIAVLFSFFKNYSFYLISFIPFVFIIFNDTSIINLFIIILISLCIYTILLLKNGLKEIKLFLKIK
jgi:O-antigen/teichoic acid export membrane protein